MGNLTGIRLVFEFRAVVQFVGYGFSLNCEQVKNSQGVKLCVFC